MEYEQVPIVANIPDTPVFFIENEVSYHAIKYPKAQPKSVGWVIQMGLGEG